MIDILMMFNYSNTTTVLQGLSDSRRNLEHIEHIEERFGSFPPDI